MVRQFDPRQVIRRNVVAFSQSFQHAPCRIAHGVQLHSSIFSREFAKLFQTGFEQRSCSVHVAPRVMMKRGCKLNHSLQEDLVIFRGNQPNFLPNLMGPEIFPQIKQSDPLSKFVVF